MAKKYETRSQDEIENLRNLTKELALFTDELRDERQSQRQELDDLRAMKRGLLLQLQASQPEAEVLGIFPGSAHGQDARKKPPRWVWRVSGTRRAAPACLRLDRMREPGAGPSAANAVPSVNPAWTSERGAPGTEMVLADDDEGSGGLPVNFSAGSADVPPPLGSSQRSNNGIAATSGPGRGFGPGRGIDVGRGAGLERSYSRETGSEYSDYGQSDRGAGFGPGLGARGGAPSVGSGSSGSRRGGRRGPGPESFGDRRYGAGAGLEDRNGGERYADDRYGGDRYGGNGYAGTDSRYAGDGYAAPAPYDSGPMGAPPPHGGGYEGEDGYGRDNLDRGESFTSGSAQSGYGPDQGAYWGEGQLPRWDSAGYGFDEAPTRFEGDDRGSDERAGHGRGGPKSQL